LTVKQVSDQIGISERFISKWFDTFRIRIAEWIENNPQDWQNKIGGIDKIVEIDEAMF
ncbi:hypothetical protein DFQ30_002358, partial [Apophysomyces sp. BC1015]